MALKIAGYPSPYNPRVLKSHIAAKVAGVALEDNTAFKFGVDDSTGDWLRNCHPLGRSPVLTTEDGYIFESGAILRYITRLDKTNSFLYGRNAFEAAQCDSWIDFSGSELDCKVVEMIVYKFKIAPMTEEQANATKEQLTAAFNGVNTWLEVRTFLVGERLTVADIAIFTYLHVLRSLGFGDLVTGKYVNRWFNTVLNVPKVAEAVKLHGTATDAPAAPAKAEKKEEKKKEEKKKEEPKPKKEEKPKEEDHGDDGDDFAAEEPKKKNPLDSLPPSAFVLDAFKREYSNKDTRKEAAPWFFANYDAAGFSCYYCKYKYNDELKMQFMTANLVRGWFQRMEGNRKYAFGIAIIAGEDSKHELSGFWVFRGKGVPESVLDVEDTELFDWIEIPDINADKEKITDYLAWEGPSFAQPVLEGRAFK